MFANRFTILVDACSLFSPLTRNLLLSLAEAEFFRVQWSARILEETERAIVRSYEKKGIPDGAARARMARTSMETAFAEAMVEGFDFLVDGLPALPDPNDGHVIAAAIKAKADVIVTENLRDFPSDVLTPFGIEAKTADSFLADTIDLNVGKAVPVVRRMRERFKRPVRTATNLLLDMEARGLTQVVDVLRSHVQSL